MSAPFLYKLIKKIILEEDKKKYYVGKIIMDTANVNPATYLGFGEWILWGAGRVPVGVDINDSDFNVVEKICGEKTSQHSHNYKIGFQCYHAVPAGSGAGNTIRTYDYKTKNWANSTIDSSMGTTPSRNSGLSSGMTDTTVNGYSSESSTSLESSSTIQPSITCYMWKRIS